MKVYEKLLDTITQRGAAYLILIDPDKINGNKLAEFVSHCEKCGVDGFLIGGSLMFTNHLYESISIIKESSSLPVIIFPGSVSQVVPNADAILFISLISGRNPDQLIGEHVLAAPTIKKTGIEPIPTGYMLVESGSVTTVEYISGSKPLPRKKPEIATATALAAQYLGMKMVYLEAGSGASKTVPDNMVKMVSGALDIPVIVGGGIRTPEEAAGKVANGAKAIVTGNYFEDESNWHLIEEFANAIHGKPSTRI